MGAVLTDLAIPDYAINVPVVSGTVWYGPIISLAGAQGFWVNGYTFNGAAGTLIFNPTVGVGPNGLALPNYPTLANGYPASRNALSLSISANNQVDGGLTVTDARINAQAFYFTFNPTASGNLTVGVNIRKSGT